MRSSTVRSAAPTSSDRSSHRVVAERARLLAGGRRWRGLQHGDANFYGSLGGAALTAPIVGLHKSPDGNGYWLFGADGGVFSYGDTTFLGSLGAFTWRPRWWAVRPERRTP